ncbi:hypothetical protein L486_00676 [Kwoniella mangroviensis CBS 10435]|uniref:Major facilitator superfamily (MFS) profile domain-containing protein n=1 Tax=Kwoniella mangroviensis CBS 10435 TaxID=1331196 RepID=A0A1B9IZV4_9TREE|nr:uncharacterized protein I203_04208 [Kwoniella mangroviensis CBS 8507]OCF61032.1 hypothetical protein L486_00676 [Kwoniella mangroviensis CBS 10435]OCF66632.1 hypothetical protein I203_04208 [Kwoniella mangroviensis CBS 8507]OCF74220.1 hypothetical protein I204_04590 [Kwoniella mangroviensis CBS 8886]
MHPDDKDLEISHIEGGLHTIDKKGGDAIVADTAAADYVDSSIIITEEENLRLRRKIYKHLLPVMCVAYITQSLDKGTLGSASIMGWQKDVGAVGQDYALTSTLLWVGIICGEPIVNQFVRKLPVAKVLGISIVIWSALVMGLAFSLDVKPVFAIRFLLGFFESSFSPCLVAITVQWFTAHEQTLITTVWQAMFAAAGFASNLIAYGFYQLGGDSNAKTKGLYTWQWMTVVIALISFIAAVIVLVFLPDTPVQARWATKEEKVKYVERVRTNDQGIQQKVWRSDQAREVLRDPLPWLLFGMMFIQSTVVGGLNTFNNLLIKNAFGFTTSQALLLALPLAVFQVILYFLIGWLGTKTRQTVYCMVGYVMVNIAGSIVLITVAPSSKTKVGLLITFYLMQCCQATNPSMYAMLSRNVAGQTKKSVVYAIFFVGWAGGNALGPQLFQAKWASRYINSLYIHIALYCAFIIDVLVMRWICVSRNKKRDALMQGQVNAHAHAFEDKTDLQNIEFRYSY